MRSASCATSLGRQWHKADTAGRPQYGQRRQLMQWPECLAAISDQPCHASQLLGSFTPALGPAASARRRERRSTTWLRHMLGDCRCLLQRYDGSSKMHHLRHRLPTEPIAGLVMPPRFGPGAWLLDNEHCASVPLRGRRWSRVTKSGEVGRWVRARLIGKTGCAATKSQRPIMIHFQCSHRAAALHLLFPPVSLCASARTGTCL